MIGAARADERFGDACLQGLEGFSHVDVLLLPAVNALLRGSA